MIAEDIVQTLENERSTKELIKKICNKIGLQLDETKLNAALPYFELRHKLVHTDGKVDADFMRRYPMFTYKDDYIVLKHETITDAKSTISELLLSIDTVAIAKGILQPNTL